MALASPAITPMSPPTADLLLVDATPESATYASMLRGSYRVSTTGSTDVAKQFLRRNPPAVVVTELDLPGVDGVEICREAKRLPIPPPVLVTTTQVERVPAALAAGCDAVLLKPFAPNLLVARIGRLIRAGSEALRARAREQSMKTSHLLERSEALLDGTNRVWPQTRCPYCENGGVVSFEYCSHRRAWYACLKCTKVWIAKRQE